MPKGVRKVQPKTQRGAVPGKRGPAYQPGEQEASKVIVVEVERPRNTSGLKRGDNPKTVNQQLSKQKLKLAKQLSGLIREIGEETIDVQKGWTRLEAVVRRLYSDALSGKTAAQALLFERGWGKVPTPVQLDMRGEILTLMEKTGLTVDELGTDPVLKEIVGDVIIDGDFRAADAGTERTAQ